MFEMKNITGCMIPLTSCALNEARYSASFCSAKTAADSFCRPKTLTSAWPEYISSMCALSAPVDFHCATNCGCDFLPIFAATKTETGMVSRATSASSGEIQSIIASTPTIVSSELSS